MSTRLARRELRHTAIAVAAEPEKETPPRAVRMRSGAAGGDFASKQFFKPEGADGVKGKVGHGLSVGVCSERGGQRRPSPWPSTTYLSEVRPSRPTGPRT